MLPLALILAASAWAKDCPSGMAALDAKTCIDKYEASLVVSLGDREEFWPPFEGPNPKKYYRAVSAMGRFPQAHISGEQAALACEHSGKRLCTAPEWKKACRGPNDTTYPYGGARKPKTCNDSRGHSMVRLFGKDWRGKNMNDPRLNQLPDSLATTRQFASCTNGYDVYDMVGNLHEWVADPKGLFLGGFYTETEMNGSGCEYKTDAHPVSYRDYSTGFRCCKSR